MHANYYAYIKFYFTLTTDCIPGSCKTRHRKSMSRLANWLRDDVLLRSSNEVKTCCKSKISKNFTVYLRLSQQHDVEQRKRL